MSLSKVTAVPRNKCGAETVSEKDEDAEYRGSGGRGRDDEFEGRGREGGRVEGGGG
jgi:hypothetical protein